MSNLSGIQIVEVAAGEVHNLILTNDHTLFVFGTGAALGMGNNGPFSYPTINPFLVGMPVKSIAGGVFSYHSLVLLQNGTLLAMGDNTYGQLGLGDTNARRIPTTVAFFAGLHIVGISAQSQTFVTLQDGSVFAFGHGESGELGLSNQMNIAYPKMLRMNGTNGHVQACSFYSYFITANAWSMVNRSLPVCFGRDSEDPLVCSSQGYCAGSPGTGSGTCLCNPYYTGNNCELPICFGLNSSDPMVCGGIGTCKFPNNCDCGRLYRGNTCQFPICNGYDNRDPRACSYRGRCISPNNCSCTDAGFSGDDCEFVNCYGRRSDHPLVCSGHGTCSSPDQCQCLNGFYENDCSMTNCFNKNSSNPIVCSGNGFCIAPNECECRDGYVGDECDAILCFGRNSTNRDVCSGRGQCASPNKCICLWGFGGDICETYLEYILIGSLLGIVGICAGMVCLLSLLFFTVRFVVTKRNASMEMKERLVLNGESLALFQKDSRERVTQSSLTDLKLGAKYSRMEEWHATSKGMDVVLKKLKFDNESMAMAMHDRISSVIPHENVISLLGTYLETDTVCVIRTAIPKITCQDFIAKKLLSEKEIIYFGLQILRGMENLLNYDISIGEITLADIFVSFHDNDPILLLDFSPTFSISSNEVKRKDLKTFSRMLFEMTTKSCIMPQDYKDAEEMLSRHTNHKELIKFIISCWNSELRLSDAKMRIEKLLFSDYLKV
jgi:hypothetical protein